MVQIAGWKWTLEAVHHACLLAHKTNAAIALVKMVPIQHAIWIGTPLGSPRLTEQDRVELYAYTRTMEHEDIRYSVVVFQYFTLARGIAEAAHEVEAQVVFATLPYPPIPYWHRLQSRSLRRRLAHHQCLLIDQEWIAAHSGVLDKQKVSDQKRAGWIRIKNEKIGEN
jgi:hypothetical protein